MNEKYIILQGKDAEISALSNSLNAEVLAKKEAMCKYRNVPRDLEATEEQNNQTIRQLKEQVDELENNLGKPARTDAEVKEKFLRDIAYKNLEESRRIALQKKKEIESEKQEAELKLSETTFKIRELERDVSASKTRKEQLEKAPKLANQKIETLNGEAISLSSESDRLFAEKNTWKGLALEYRGPIHTMDLELGQLRQNKDALTTKLQEAETGTLKVAQDAADKEGQLASFRVDLEAKSNEVADASKILALNQDEVSKLEQQLRSLGEDLATEKAAKELITEQRDEAEYKLDDFTYNFESLQEKHNVLAELYQGQMKAKEAARDLYYNAVKAISNSYRETA